MVQSLEEQYAKEIKTPFTDTLTGLFNFGFFQLSLNREVQRSSIHGKPFTLALVDIDNFSEFNRQYGPLKGDLVLKNIGEIIKKTIRKSDFAARYANDEFAVLQVECSPENAAISMERISQEVKTISDDNLALSIGIATYYPDKDTLEILNDKAKNALQRAKFNPLENIYFLQEEEYQTRNQKPRVLIVDDDPITIEMMKKILEPLDYEVFKATNGADSLTLISKIDIDLILLDIMMPGGIDGYEVCRRLKSREETRMIPVIMVTALNEMGSKIKGIEFGADDFITKPPNPLELQTRTKSLIKVKRLNQNLISIEKMLASLANMVEAKDTYTDGHIKRVACLSLDLGRQLGLSAYELESLKLGGILHDIGKLSIPGEILNKSSDLSEKEWELMKSHPNIGHKLCLPLKGSLGGALDIIRHHHEKLNGDGYPDGLTKAEITIPTRIMAVVDIYDALITDRPYHKALPIDEALDILKEAGQKGELDMDVVNALDALVN